MPAPGGLTAQMSSSTLTSRCWYQTESSGRSIMSIWSFFDVQPPEQRLYLRCFTVYFQSFSNSVLFSICYCHQSVFRIIHWCLQYKECVQLSCFFHVGPPFNWSWVEVGDWGHSYYFLCRAGCQGCDWIPVILSDYCASAGSRCPLHVWINSRISLTDLPCVPCRQIGQLVPRWQLYRYGGNWCGAQGHAADSSRGLLEVPSLHWSSHVPEI